jgi:hypothetical protein
VNHLFDLEMSPQSLGNSKVLNSKIWNKECDGNDASYLDPQSSQKANQKQ